MPDLNVVPVSRQSLNDRLSRETLPFISWLLGLSDQEGWGTTVLFQLFWDGPEGTHPPYGQPKALTLHGSLALLSSQLEEYNQQGYGICLTVNLTKGSSRTMDQIIGLRAWQADLDLEKCQAVFDPSALRSVASLIVNSGHGLHIYWKAVVGNPSALDLGQVRADLLGIQHALASMGADLMVCNLNQAMRLPGYYNCKEDPVLVTIQERTDKVYTQEEIQAIYPHCVKHEASEGANPPDSNFDWRKIPDAKKEVVKRAGTYLSKIPGAVAGEGGHEATFVAAMKVGPGFLLSPRQTLELLLKEFNPRCSPPWSQEELQHKVEDAYAKASQWGQMLQGGKGGETEADSEEDTKSPTELATDLVEALVSETWHNQNRTAFVTISNKGHLEHMSVGSSTFKSFVQGIYYGHTQRPLRKDPLQQVVDTFSAKAIHQGAMYTTHNRVARQEDRVFLNLSDPSHQVVEVTRAGWTIKETSAVSVKFTTNAQALPLVSPQSGGSIVPLWGLLNTNFEGFLVIVSWLTLALAKTGQYPILCLTGEAGSAKTYTSTLCRRLVDPHLAGHLSAISSDHELMIIARGSYCLVLNNLSKIPRWLSDALCGVAQGTALTKRKLYEDDETVVLQSSNPTILNGISDLVQYTDLLDRTLKVVLQRIPESDRKSERELDAAFNAVSGQILGALLDLVAGGLADLDHKLECPPRLVDAATFLDAAEKALLKNGPIQVGENLWERGAMIAAWKSSQTDAQAGFVENDPLSTALFRATGGRSWKFIGTSTDLGIFLKPFIGDLKVPTSPEALGRGLRGSATALRTQGWDFQWDHPKRRQVTITYTGSDLPGCDNTVSVVPPPGVSPLGVLQLGPMDLSNPTWMK